MKKRMWINYIKEVKREERREEDEEGEKRRKHDEKIGMNCIKENIEERKEKTKKQNIKKTKVWKNKNI